MACWPFATLAVRFALVSADGDLSSELTSSPIAEIWSFHWTSGSQTLFAQVSCGDGDPPQPATRSATSAADATTSENRGSTR